MVENALLNTIVDIVSLKETTLVFAFVKILGTDT